MITGGYVLDVQCDGDHACFEPHYAAQFVAETAGAARKLARQAGWRLDLTTDTALCPKHSARGER